MDFRLFSSLPGPKSNSTPARHCSLSSPSQTTRVAPTTRKMWFADAAATRINNAVLIETVESRMSHDIRRTSADIWLSVDVSIVLFDLYSLLAATEHRRRRWCQSDKQWDARDHLQPVACMPTTLLILRRSMPCYPSCTASLRHFTTVAGKDSFQVDYVCLLQLVM